MKPVFIITCLLGLSSVMMGAAGDHLLEGHLTPETQERFTVALHYHQLYSVVLLALGLYGLQTSRGKLFLTASTLFLLGIVIFSGTLYASILFTTPALIMGTPVGGTMLMAGWLTLAGYGIRGHFGK